MALRINEEELNFRFLDAGGYPMWEYNGEYFTGIIFGNEADGKLSYEKECQEGFEEGFYRSYHSNCQLDEEYTTKGHVVVSGTYKQWDKNGNLLKQW